MSVTSYYLNNQHIFGGKTAQLLIHPKEKGFFSQRNKLQEESQLWKG